MTRPERLRVVLLKPSKYTPGGHVERFWRGSMPNTAPPYLASLTPDEVEGVRVETHLVDEWVHTDLDYLRLLHREPGTRILLALVGCQSHQLHRSLDLAAYARKHGDALTVIGGPHPMTCDTTVLQGRGLSFSLAEAELVWPKILQDAVLNGQLADVYGADRRWADRLDPPVLRAPPKEYLARSRQVIGIHPVRGCPYPCNFCSVVKISGRNLRSQSVETTIASLQSAKRAGVDSIFFTSDNFNKYPEAAELLNAMIDEKVGVRFCCQCDVQVGRQPELIELLGRAGCVQMFIGVESFSRETLKSVKKNHNQLKLYEPIVRFCHEAGISAHFSNILGFAADTRESMQEHLEKLRELAPRYASFYLMTPIPGTEQYDDYLRDGLITELNLDRFDATCYTWRHPNLSRKEFCDALPWAYREFYRVRDALPRWLPALRRGGRSGVREFALGMAYWAYARHAARSHLLPSAGGFGSRKLDGVADYIDLRRSMFGLTHAPLPTSLKLSAADEELNRNAKLFLQPVVPGARPRVGSRLPMV